MGAVSDSEKSKASHFVELLAISGNWGSFFVVSLQQEPYYSGSILGALILETPTSARLCQANTKNPPPETATELRRPVDRGSVRELGESDVFLLVVSMCSYVHVTYDIYVYVHMYVKFKTINPPEQWSRG